MNKILFICGPTATGKTRLALRLARIFKGEIISSDSRQVYQGMDIGTGKDMPEGTRFKVVKKKLRIIDDDFTYGFYDMERISVWLLDLAKPNQNFTIAHYLKIFEITVKNIQVNNNLPIIVGGAGFYLNSILSVPETINIPPNLSFRKKIADCNVSQLIEILKQVDNKKWLSMNNSDKFNPRRLIRTIEVAEFKKNHRVSKKELPLPFHNKLMIGLTAQKSILYKKIIKRVGQRFRMGILEEVKNLIMNGYHWDYKSMNTLGYKEWKNYLEGEQTIEKSLEQWFQGEKKYAQRQLTWFKKTEDINWFDISNRNHTGDIEKLVRKWYTKM